MHNKGFTTSRYLEKLIAEGEHREQDFKFAINDTRKIARTLVAFANTNGGRLLVGVKDNGKVVGVSSDEEYYMIESAAKLHCTPPVEFKTNTILHEGKTVLEILVSKSQLKPHKVPDKDGKAKAYIRVNDQNIIANRVIIKVWERQKSKVGTIIKFSQAETTLLSHLSTHPTISVESFQELAGIKRHAAERVIINLLSINVIEMEISGENYEYKLTPGYNHSP